MTFPRVHGYTQLATYWEKLGSNQYGEEVYADPIGMYVRWEDTAGVMRTPNEQTIEYKSVIFVPTEVTEESFLALGEFTNVIDPHEALINAQPIRTVVKIPSLRTNSNEIRAYI